MPSHLEQYGHRKRIPLPRPLPMCLLNLPLQRYQERIGRHPKLHVIGIEAAGTILATLIIERGISEGGEGWMSDFNPKAHHSEVIAPKAPGLYTVLVDNSIKSGDTMIKTLQSLRAQKVAVDTVVKIVDYQDELEEQVNGRITAEFGVPIVSLITREEMIKQLEKLEPKKGQYGDPKMA